MQSAGSLFLELFVGQADANFEYPLFDFFLAEKFSEAINCNWGIDPPLVELLHTPLKSPIKLELKAFRGSEPAHLVLA